MHIIAETSYTTGA